MINSIHVIPGYTFFYWGFTLPKKEYDGYKHHFGLKEGCLVKDIKFVIKGKKYPAKIRLARITTKNYPNRQVVRICYETQYDTLKALRRLFIYSYAATIGKKKPDLKELMELEYLGNNEFKVKAIGKQKTDFDDMFLSLESKNLLEYWRDSKKKRRKNFFIDYSRKWIPVSQLREFRNRVNVIYFLYNSLTKQFYVGKANKLGDRVKKGAGRIGLDKDWDWFMYFEIDPEYNAFIEQIEAFTIRAFASLLPNQVGSKPLEDKEIKLVNRQLRKK